jgi:pimeloyl-ACP methyl ester carboxylesterase
VKTCTCILLLLAAANSASGQSQIIEFTEFAGPSLFNAIEPPLQVGAATISGGQILTNTTNLPIDQQTVYGTADFCTGCLPAITIDFALPVSKFSVFLLNGSTVTFTYTVADNQGGSQIIVLEPNVDSGAGLVALPDSNITQVIITSGNVPSDPGWDFLVAYIGFTPTAPVLVDPVASPTCGGGCLLVGPFITTNSDLLATQGTIVQNVASDGVTQVVVRIPVAAAGQQLTLSLMPTTSNTALGGISDPLLGGPSGSGPLTVNSVNTSAGPMAFAVYRAPMDFSQGGPDDQASYRTVTLQSQIGTGPVGQIAIAIVRPPVVLVHGLWDRSASWGTFEAALKAGSQDLFVETADYSSPLMGITATSPGIYLPFQLAMARASALGFAYNAPNVLSQINQIIGDFKVSNNAAAVQADVVAHSMGGDITRSLRSVPSFASSNNFGNGSVHKLITIGTPYLGSPIATQLLQTSNVCVTEILASIGNLSFSTVTFAGGTVDGAVGDLSGDGYGGGLSPALAALQNPFNIPISTASIDGVMVATNLNGLNCTVCVAQFIRTACGGNVAPAPLAQNLTPAAWPTLLGGSSDAVVPATSQRNGSAVPTSPGMEISGVVHSRGMVLMGFNGPGELDNSGVAGNVLTQVFLLLNEFLTGIDYRPL